MNGGIKDMKIGMRILLALAAVWGGLSCRSVQAQESVSNKPLNRILLIYDASNSMNARWQSASKMTISKRLIAEIVDSLSMVDNVQLALRVYGHQSHYPLGLQRQQAGGAIRTEQRQADKPCHQKLGAERRHAYRVFAHRSGQGFSPLR